MNSMSKKVCNSICCFRNDLPHLFQKFIHFGRGWLPSANEVSCPKEGQNKGGRYYMKADVKSSHCYLVLDGLHHTAKAPMCQHHLWICFCFVEVKMSGFSFAFLWNLKKPSGSGERGHLAGAAKALSVNQEEDYPDPLPTFKALLHFCNKIGGNSWSKPAHLL